MLIRIVTTNFRSYGQETEFTMLPSSNVRRKDWHVHSQGRGANVLRTAVIYGANGAGKSCLVKALGRLQTMVATGSLPPTAFRDANKYNGPEMPVSIQVEFGTESAWRNGCIPLLRNPCACLNVSTTYRLARQASI